MQYGIDYRIRVTGCIDMSRSFTEATVMYKYSQRGLRCNVCGD